MISAGFIFPSSEYLYDPYRGDPHTHFQILTVLDDNFRDGIACSLIDLRGIKKKFAGYHIPQCDVYLHSVYTLDYKEQKAIVEFLRRAYPDAVHIAGGPHVHEFKTESMQLFDSIVLGDGEESIIRAVKDHQKKTLQKVYEQPKPLDLDQYPFPRRHYLPRTAVARQYMMNVKGKKKYDDLYGTTVVFSRGCPGNCFFCAMPQVRKYNPGLRFRRPRSIADEIDYLKREYQIQVLSLLDEIGFPPLKAPAVPYLEAIGKTNISWRAQCRLDGLDPEVIKLARQAGCLALGVGIESVSQQCLDIINKQINLDKAKQTIRRLRKNDIETRIYLILGLPGEPPDIEARTWNFIKEVEPASVILSLFTVRPGTEVFNHPDKFGIAAIDTNWEKTMHMFSRYENETPSLNFKYKPLTPFGRSRTNEEIIKGYMDLQQKIKEEGYGPAPRQEPKG